jgi:hypothetical protein
MSWSLKEEFIDAEHGRHVAIFRNRDTGAEHHLVNLIHAHTCPTCGHVKDRDGTVDFEKCKADELERLNADHKKHVAPYLAKYPRVPRRQKSKA